MSTHVHIIDSFIRFFYDVTVTELLEVDYEGM
jgi:hypothetical protein